MNEARYFKAPWSQWLVIMSAIASVLCVGLAFVLHLRVYPLAPLGFLSVLMLFIALMPVACLFFRSRDTPWKTARCVFGEDGEVSAEKFALGPGESENF